MGLILLLSIPIFYYYWPHKDTMGIPNTEGIEDDPLTKIEFDDTGNLPYWYVSALGDVGVDQTWDYYLAEVFTDDAPGSGNLSGGSGNSLQDEDDENVLTGSSYMNPGFGGIGNLMGVCIPGGPGGNSGGAGGNSGGAGGNSGGAGGNSGGAGSTTTFNLANYEIDLLQDNIGSTVNYANDVINEGIDNPTPAHSPEPATLLLLGSGLAGIGLLGRKRFFKK